MQQAMEDDDDLGGGIGIQLRGGFPSVGKERGSISLKHNCPRVSKQRTAISLDRARWSGCSSVAMAPQIARSYAMGFLPVGLCEVQSLCTLNANNDAGKHHCCCDGYRREYAVERLDGTGLPLGCVPGDQGHTH
ncbi:hypothetical protein AVEN_13527-1 [Araneus ventricosus]|uniref:Uncharacterized protein n=1 Tax=Araneus ventricosus TaxID=182803 RepID=A0A4Y2SCP1_ARAVE|nr:hypothetical protein AVEN_235046-1 [Araneus ventricosus]GBN85998.1 hypothetical protein AVEN_13527-1 [Araneus ventricosus]